MQQNLCWDNYDARHFVAVLGISPAVITETLWAIAQQGWKPPTHIHLICTQVSQAALRQQLLDHPNQPLRELFVSTHWGQPEFELNIILISRDGQPLADIVSEADSLSAADTMVRLLRDLTRETSAIHASIAGGRKTMGYHLAMAVMLFGRPQDQLSHVLVTPPFESSPNFLFPGQPWPAHHATGALLEPDKATVHLSLQPFVRFRDNIPQRAFDGDLSFKDLVLLADLKPQQVSLKLSRRQRTLWISQRNFPAVQPLAEIRLNDVQTALLAALFTAPDLKLPWPAESDTEFSHIIACELLRNHGWTQLDALTSPKAFKEALEEAEVDERTISGIIRCHRTLPPRWIASRGTLSPSLSRLKKALITTLGTWAKDLFTQESGKLRLTVPAEQLTLED